MQKAKGLSSTLSILTLITEVIMSKELLISMLRKGQTGDEILTILDLISADDDVNSAEPTLEEIQL